MSHDGCECAVRLPECFEVVECDPGVASRPLLVCFTGNEAHAFDEERIGAHLGQDDTRHFVRNSLDQRHQSDDRPNRDDVSENREERTKFVDPDRAKRNPDHLTDQTAVH